MTRARGGSTGRRARRIRSSREYVVAGWTIWVGHPMVLGADYWVVSRADGSCARYYDLLADARRAATTAGPGGTLAGGLSII